MKARGKRRTSPRARKATGSTPVGELRNIGATIAHRLAEIGIATRAELAAAGPVEAYCRIRASCPGQTIPVCYYLYSLEGALRDEHWDALDPAVKKTLRDSVAAHAARRNR